MADITQTPANFKTGTHSTFQQVQAGEAIAAAGNLCYSDATDSGKYKRASTASAAAANVRGVSIAGAADDGQFPLMVFELGKVFDPGGTVAVGQTYGVSDNAGKIAPVDDWGTGDHMTIIGIGVTTSLIMVTVLPTGYTHT